MSETISKKNEISPSSRTYCSQYVSPELLLGKYEEKTDVWAAGVILFMMVSGKTPIEGSSITQISKNIKKKIGFHGSLKKTVSTELQELLGKMLCESSGRFSSNQVLDHDWLRNNGTCQKSDKIKEFDIEGFKKLAILFNMKKDIINLISDNMKDGEILKFKDELEAVKEADGLVSLKDFKEKFNKIFVNDDKIKIDDILKKYDLDDTNTKIDFAQYLLEASEKIEYFREENLRESFMAIDLDCTGKLTKKCIYEILIREKICDEVLNNIVKECDLNGENSAESLMDYNDFLAMMDKSSILPYRNIIAESMPNDTK